MAHKPVKQPPLVRETSAKADQVGDQFKRRYLEAKLAGYRTRVKGDTSDNPFPSNTARHKAWNEGWEEAGTDLSPITRLIQVAMESGKTIPECGNIREALRRLPAGLK